MLITIFLLISEPVLKTVSKEKNNKMWQILICRNIICEMNFSFNKLYCFNVTQLKTVMIMEINQDDQHTKLCVI